MEKIIEMRIEDLNVNPKYEHIVLPLDKDSFSALASSIEKDGVRDPIYINSENVILDGHHRYRAAKKLKLESVPCRVLDFESVLDEREFVIVSNVQRRQMKTAEKSRLAIEMRDIESERAEIRIRAGGTIPSEGRTKEIIAMKLGISPRTVQSVFTSQNIANEIKDDRAKRIFESMFDAILPASKAVQELSAIKQAIERAAKQSEAKRLRLEEQKRQIEARRKANIERAERLKNNPPKHVPVVEEDCGPVSTEQKEKILKNYRERNPHTEINMDDIDFSNGCWIDLKKEVDPKDQALYLASQLDDVDDPDNIAKEILEKVDEETLSEIAEPEVVEKVKELAAITIEDKTKIVTIGAKKDNNEVRSLNDIIFEFQEYGVTVLIDARLNQRVIAGHTTERMIEVLHEEGITYIDFRPEESSLDDIKFYLKEKVITKETMSKMMLALYDRDCDFNELADQLLEEGNIGLITDEPFSGSDYRGRLARKIGSYGVAETQKHI